MLLTGCPEWFEVSDPSEAQDDELTLEIPSSGPAVFPSAPAVVGGRGPLIPGTPALRVPDAGYWTRCRLHVADIVLPYSWVSFVQGARGVTLRLAAMRRGEVDGPTVPNLRAVVPIALPRGTDATSLAGLTLGEDALSNATVSLRTTWQDSYIVKLSRLTIEVVDASVVAGTFEGTAVRGKKGRVARRFEAGFVALRGPAVGVLDLGPPAPENVVAP